MKDIDFKKYPGGLVPAIIQDDRSGKVLMLGYMNREALRKTQAENRVTFFSRSKDRLWTKGETSGHFLDVVEIRPDCDADALLVKVRPHGPVCHTGADTCFSEVNELPFFEQLGQVIDGRFTQPVEGSYVSSLAVSGINRMAQKVGEEAVEVVIEAKDDNDELFLNEAADLVFHLMILLRAKGHTLGEVEDVLRSRAK
ncbi:MAG: bifunctional phosphoribosyl-AMP cyclohydrolase/phosphoribosyl-ATP diphosphatase HisIE [Saprospiraceae bacterium]